MVHRPTGHPWAGMRFTQFSSLRLLRHSNKAHCQALPAVWKKTERSTVEKDFAVFVITTVSGNVCVASYYFIAEALVGTSSGSFYRHEGDN